MPRPQRYNPDGFKSKNEAIDKAFYSVINTSFKNPRKICKFCHREMDFNTTRLQNHLDNCTPYKKGNPPDEPAGDSQQSLPIMVAVMPQTKAEH